jgi:hypothetical protein
MVKGMQFTNKRGETRMALPQTRRQERLRSSSNDEGRIKGRELGPNRALFPTEL